jgi:hypothetical protein
LRSAKRNNLQIIKGERRQPKALFVCYNGHVKLETDIAKAMLYAENTTLCPEEKTTPKPSENMTPNPAENKTLRPAERCDAKLWMFALFNLN